MGKRNCKAVEEPKDTPQIMGVRKRLITVKEIREALKKGEEIKAMLQKNSRFPAPSDRRYTRPVAAS